MTKVINHSFVYSLFKKVAGGLIILFFIISAGSLNAQNSIDKLKNDLRQQLAEIQNKITLYREQIKQKEKETKTLKREIEILEDQIQQIELEIQQTELAIKEIDLTIEEKEKEIAKFNQQIDQQKVILTEYLRTIYQYDQISLPEIILKRQNFSDFFEEVQSLENLQAKIQIVLQEFLSFKNKLEDEKNVLEEKKEEQNQLRSLQEIQKRSSERRKEEKNNLLKQTKGQESLFKKLMKKAYSDIESIKNQLYLLEGVGLKMTLGEALTHAQLASSKTGVRPAFLLAVLKKESSWGTNVGTGTWRQDMHPRDHQAFLEITKKLGLNPDKMPVSRKPSYGWGGAMGPAQFLPTTWQFYEEEIANLTGHRPPNPWDIDDAFVGAALKLAKNGANQQTYQAEWKAAMIYFAGGKWSNPIFSFYGDSVMELAEVIQEQIDLIR